MHILFSFLAVAIACLASLNADGASFPVQLSGGDLAGGANALYGADKHSRRGVNYVYAQPTGSAARMAGVFHLEKLSKAKLWLFVEGMDDDVPGPCRIKISLNGDPLFEGASRFPNAQWRTLRFPVPPGILVSGANEISVINLEPAGTTGTPPWFMVARCAIAQEGFRFPVPARPRLKVRLPTNACLIPEPVSPGEPVPGFKFRGTKGWCWTPEQYLGEIPFLQTLQMNFLMNCYGSMYTSAPGEPWRNEWWKPMTETRKAAYARVIRSCREHQITFCFAFHPQIASSRPLDATNLQDLDDFYQHFAWAQQQGVRWFSVSLDDVSWGKDGPAKGAAAHSTLVNTVLERLRVKDPGAQLIFCPGPYWGDGNKPEDRAYLEVIATEMHPDVYVFWTGDEVVCQKITAAAARSYKQIVQHRLFLWDNYPVNDANPTLHLGPVSGRDPELCKIIDGYISNPLASQHQINRIPLATCADYAYNPAGYDPERAIGQAICCLAKTKAQKRALRDLVEAYPGLIVTGGGTASNPVRAEFLDILSGSFDSRAATKFIQRLESIVKALDTQFPGQFTQTKGTIDGDVSWLKKEMQKSPLTDK